MDKKMSSPGAFALVVLCVSAVSIVGCSPYRRATEPAAVPHRSDTSVLYRESSGPILRAAHDEVVVPIRVGLPVVVLFPKPILAALRSSCAPLSVGRNAHALSITLKRPLANTAPLLWVELEDHTLFALRLVEPKRSMPARARVEISDTTVHEVAPREGRGCCQ
jgi:hypothetical protein